ncbi:MAG: hypothetical protein RKE49_13460 [Oceanicaulis sp.]
MRSITINLDEATERWLRTRAAESGWSVEEEARRILRDAVGSESSRRNLAAEIRSRVDAAGGGADLNLPKRTPMRDPVRFD